jgi:hypothetical protein
MYKNFFEAPLSSFQVPSSASLRRSEKPWWRIAAHERPDLIDEVWGPWRTQILHTTLLSTPEASGDFWQRFMQLPPWFGGNVSVRVGKFVRTEYTVFFNHLKQQREFTELLASLPRDFPENKLPRLLELCFLPGVIIPFCLATAKYWEQVRKIIGKQKKRLHALNRQRQGYPLWSPRLKITTAQEYTILIPLMEEELRLAPLQAWKKQLGMSRNTDLETQTHNIWSRIFLELVDLLRPYCSGPKRWHLDTTPSAMPDQVFVVASRLMHLAQPTLWPDRPDLVKSRYFTR